MAAGAKKTPSLRLMVAHSGEGEVPDTVLTQDLGRLALHRRLHSDCYCWSPSLDWAARSVPTEDLTQSCSAVPSCQIAPQGATGKTEACLAAVGRAVAVSAPLGGSSSAVTRVGMSWIVLEISASASPEVGLSDEDWMAVQGSSKAMQESLRSC
jgi:hypothetical protein